MDHPTPGLSSSWYPARRHARASAYHADAAVLVDTHFLCCYYYYCCCCCFGPTSTAAALVRRPVRSESSRLSKTRCVQQRPAGGRDRRCRRSVTFGVDCDVDAPVLIPPRTCQGTGHVDGRWLTVLSSTWWLLFWVLGFGFWLLLYFKTAETKGE